MTPQIRELFQQKLDLRLYFPDFLAALCRVKQKCLERGTAYVSYYGFRSMGESHRLRMLYLSGKGPRAAPAGRSAHNFGLGDDSALDGDLTTPGLQADWAAERYLVLAEEAKREGLHCGAAYNDHGHLSWPGWEGAKLDKLMPVWNASKAPTLIPRLEEVWAYVRKHS